MSTTNPTQKNDAAQYTYHRESPAQGGAKYVRCEECGRECVPADPDRILHAPSCSERDV